MENEDSLFLSFANSPLNKIILAKPRIFNVGYPAYLIWILHYTAIILRDYFLGVLSTECVVSPLSPQYTCLWVHLVLLLVIIISISWLGSSLVSKIEYQDGERRIYREAHSVLVSLIRDAPSLPKLSAKLLLAGLGFINTLISIWIWLKYQTDLPSLNLIKLLSRNTLGNLNILVLDILAVASVTLFWNAVTILFIHIIYIYYWILSNISRAIKMEIEGRDKLRLDEIFNDIITSERPALAYLSFRGKLLMLTENLTGILKKALLLMILAILLPYLLDMATGQSTLSFGVISGAFIGLGLSIPTIYVVYVIKKWSNLLHQAISIELKDLKIRSKANGKSDLIDVITEIEYLVRELGSPLMQSRDLWETIAALVSLIAAIIGVLSGFRS